MRLTTILLVLVFGASCASTQPVMDTTCKASSVITDTLIKATKIVPEAPPQIKVSSLNFKDYSEPINKVKRKFLKEQFSYSQVSTGRYYFKIFPVSMYPFFCLNKKIKIEPDKYRIIFSENCNTNIGAYLDGFSMDHVQIAVLQYITFRLEKPWCRTYILFSFKKNYATGEWDSERDPIIVSMLLDSKTGYYYIK